MLDALPISDLDFREIREGANRIARLLREETALSPTTYQELIESMSSLALLWRKHINCFAEAALSVRPEGTHPAIFLAQLNKDSSELADHLESLSAAGWPRTASLGLNALRLRAPELLAAIFRQIEKERSIPLPDQCIEQHEPFPCEAVGTAAAVSPIPS